jgi:GxxExxY protein
MNIITKRYLDELTYNILGAAIEVHRALGPGLLENIYHVCLKHELQSRTINFKSELTIPVVFKEIKLTTVFRCDLFVEECLVVELKTVETFAPIHKAKLISYMKLLNAPKGILINFNSVNIFKEGQKTFVNEIFSNLPDN